MRALVLAAPALCASWSVQGGVTVLPAAPVPARPVSAPSVPASGLYQIRCWQHGRLLFEERLTLPADGAAHGLRLSGADSAGHAMYVAETANATCLARMAREEPRWPR